MREVGKTLFSVPHSDFRDRIAAAIRTKVAAESRMSAELAMSTLPFAHYYVFGNAVKDAGYKWILEIWETIRREKKLVTQKENR